MSIDMYARLCLLRDSLQRIDLTRPEVRDLAAIVLGVIVELQHLERRVDALVGK